MKDKLLPKKNTFIQYIAIISVIIGIFFRFYNLSWGAPYFFHPDERNIASSISQLSYKENLNPNFFAYGSLPIYTIYFTGVFINIASNTIGNSNLEIDRVKFEEALNLGRYFSFILSLLILPIIYTISSKFASKKAGLLSLIFTSLSVGFIQYSHFATFEMWLSFFTLLLCFFSLEYMSSKKIRFFILTSITLGTLISIKVSSFALLPLPLIIFSFLNLKHLKKIRKRRFIYLEKLILKLFLFITLALIIVLFTSPFYWIDQKGFIGSIRYEASVALGTLPVFYTQGFIKSFPIIYQLIKVYPFIITPIYLIIIIIFLPFTMVKILKRKNYPLIIILLFLIVTFFSQAFLYVKWVRYYIPTLSFIYILGGVVLTQSYSFFRLKKRKYFYSKFFLSLFIFSLFIYSFSYFKTVLLDQDTRIASSIWAKNNIKNDSTILSEAYDMGIVPFNQYFSDLKLFNFYDLDQVNGLDDELKDRLKSTKYLILPSQRILQTRIEYPKLFLKSSKFYDALYNNTTSFYLIYKSPCDIFCKILYLGSPSFSYEQTVNVFDRPEVYIYKNATY